MTNEEAIEILTAAGKRRAKPELFDALDMGIAALKSQERMQRELKSLDGIAETCDKLERHWRWQYVIQIRSERIYGAMIAHTVTMND